MGTDCACLLYRLRFSCTPHVSACSGVPGLQAPLGPPVGLHPLFVSCMSVECDYMCIRAASTRRLSVSGFGGK